ncbi:hypothetical protein GCT13_20495 [Paraburkholderia sp. CNPSo 3157]|uniref:Uncharacterized protein n=1 Tax=Paraburkholderia franconis TaxID=2654983 RepID=A0A7X1THD2_9BURK|nr:hypothetical protein [Paraburkholderia franconis]MPW19213.1 hypothetical protein [Paraburkholderia franconis]
MSPLSLLTFFAAAKKVSAAPHRGNACAARRIADARDKGKANQRIADASGTLTQPRNRRCQRQRQKTKQRRKT